jgi:hypothetical protein
MLGWIRAEGAPAVGVYGLSLGGYTTALLAAFDADLACAVAGVPAADFVDLEEWHSPSIATALAAEAGVDFAAMRGILRVVSPLALEPRVPIERRYVFGGLGDRLAPPAQVRNFWRHWGRPRIVWYPGGHLSFRFEPAVQALVAEALAAGGLVREVAKR